jgi:hypothetical protein
MPQPYGWGIFVYGTPTSKPCKGVPQIKMHPFFADVVV